MKEQIDQMVSEGCPHGHDDDGSEEQRVVQTRAVPAGAVDTIAMKVVERTGQKMMLLDERPAERWACVEISTTKTVSDARDARRGSRFPCCPANHYHRMRMPTGPCSCGAKP